MIDVAEKLGMSPERHAEICKFAEERFLSGDNDMIHQAMSKCVTWEEVFVAGMTMGALNLAKGSIRDGGTLEELQVLVLRSMLKNPGVVIFRGR